MKVVVDEAKCIGCGLCATLAPTVFEMNANGKSVVRADSDGVGAEEAAGACPVAAISIEN